MLLETSGEARSSDVDPRVHKIMDLKAPDRASATETGGRTSSTSRMSDEIKFVLVGARRLRVDAASTIRERDLASDA